jgi:cytochrome bd-type quinol oxidase subunit 1
MALVKLVARRFFIGLGFLTILSVGLSVALGMFAKVILPYTDVLWLLVIIVGLACIAYLFGWMLEDVEHQKKSISASLEDRDDAAPR